MFKKRHSFKKIEKRLLSNRAHIEKARGTRWDNFLYCTKEDVHPFYWPVDLAWWENSPTDPYSALYHQLTKVSTMDKRYPQGMVKRYPHGMAKLVAVIHVTVWLGLC